MARKATDGPMNVSRAYGEYSFMSAADMTSFQQWSSNASFDAMAVSNLNQTSGGIFWPFDISDVTAGAKAMLMDATPWRAAAWLRLLASLCYRSACTAGRCK